MLSTRKRLSISVKILDVARPSASSGRIWYEDLHGRDRLLSWSSKPRPQVGEYALDGEVRTLMLC
jgi:hypothetical protein